MVFKEERCLPGEKEGRVFWVEGPAEAGMG